MTIRHRLLALTVVVLWGLNFIAIHAGLEHFPPFFFAGLRFAVMAIPVILFVPWPNVQLRWFLLYGIGFGTIQFAFLFLAMHIGMPTGLASLVLQSSAPFTVLLGVLLLGETMSLRQSGGLLVALAGMVVIGVDRAMHGEGVAVIGILLTLAGGFGWALGNIGSRLAQPDSALRLTLWMSVVPPLPLFALSLIFDGPTAGVHSLTTLGDHSGLVALVGLAYVVFLGTIAGSGLWTHLLSHFPASQVAPFSLLVPVVGITASWLLLDEVPTVAEVVGGVVIIVGCMVGMSRARRSDHATVAPDPTASDPTVSGCATGAPDDMAPTVRPTV